jgi:hypothetical protein
MKRLCTVPDLFRMPPYIAFVPPLPALLLLSTHTSIEVHNAFNALLEGVVE